MAVNNQVKAPMLAARDGASTKNLWDFARGAGRKIAGPVARFVRPAQDHGENEVKWARPNPDRSCQSGIRSDRQSSPGVRQDSCPESPFPARDRLLPACRHPVRGERRTRSSLWSCASDCVVLQVGASPLLRSLRPAGPFGNWTFNIRVFQVQAEVNIS